MHSANSFALDMPVGILSVEEWNAFWRQATSSAAIAHRFKAKIADRRFVEHFDRFDRMGFRNVAFLGNGISVLPHVCRQWGFDTWAVDISPIATAFARQNPPGVGYFNALVHGASLLALDPSLQQSGESAGAEDTVQQSPTATQNVIVSELGNNREVGRIDFDTADVRLLQPAEAFDAVVMQRVIEHFCEDELAALAIQLYERIRPGGVLVVESQFLTTSIDWTAPYNETSPELLFERAGFRFFCKDAYIWRQALERSPISRLRRIISQTASRDRVNNEFDLRIVDCERRDELARTQGERLVVFQAAG